MCRSSLGLVAVVLLSAVAGCQDSATEPPSEPPANQPEVAQLIPLPEGSFDAWLESPGGDLAFGLELQRRANGEIEAHLVNGTERILIPAADWQPADAPGHLELRMPHYDSSIHAQWDPKDKGFSGEWKKRASTDSWTTMAFHARPRLSDTNSSQSESALTLSPRYRVQFEDSSDIAVGEFETNGQRVNGTFLTTTGDYRFLAGNLANDQLTLSCFDGAHAFLFKASLSADGRLKGDFWSRDSWHETWEATPDANAKLPDALEQSVWKEDVALGELSFPNLDGEPKSLAAPEFQGQAKIIYIFGSWCPNCHDAAVFLSELQKRYESQGLSIVGLAFELTGDFERDAGQVKTYLNRHESSYPVLLAGVANKDKATESLQGLDRVRSYPTLIFFDSNDQPRAVYTGFSGPATGPAYDELRQSCIEIVEELLTEK